MILVCAWLTGVRAVYLHHVIATFQVGGLDSPAAVGAFQARFESLPQMRQIALARSSATAATWIARFQFYAPDPRAGGEQIESWTSSLPAPLSLRLVRASFYECRFYRPTRGDIVLGRVHLISAGQGSGSEQARPRSAPAQPPYQQARHSPATH